MKKKIVVFAGNECRKDREDYYYNLAYRTGKLLAKVGFVVVTGGGPGLMDKVCRGAREAGGQTFGICLNVPGRIHSAYLSQKEMFDTLNPRQERLLSVGDGYLALPGGIGTLYEITAILALKRKNEIPKVRPLIIVDGYFLEFKILMDKMIVEGFTDDSINSLFTIAKTIDEAVVKLKDAVKI